MIVRRSRQTDYFEWGVVAIFGLTLILLASPRLAAEYHRMGAAPTIRAITENKRKISEAKIIDAAGMLTNASFYASQNRSLFNGQATTELALYERFKSKGESDKTFAVLSQAHSSLQKALKAAPGDANLWYLLAETRVRLSGADKKALDFLHLSYLTGPREGWIARRRLGLSLRLWQLLPEEMRKMARREIYTLWSIGAYRRDLAWQYLRAMETGQKAILSAVLRKGENKKYEFLKLVNRLHNRD